MVERTRIWRAGKGVGGGSRHGGVMDVNGMADKGVAIGDWRLLEEERSKEGDL
jgi:hypothetical protein